MSKEEYGELLKYLGILKFVLIKFQEKENDVNIFSDMLERVNYVINYAPTIDEKIID